MSDKAALGVRVDLPRHWVVVEPERLGVAGVLFMALRPAAGDRGFTTNLTVDGRARRSGEPLTTLADAAVRQVEQVCGPVSLTHRADSGAGLAQRLAFRSPSGDLVQCQAFLPIADHGRRVLQVVLTATPERYGSVAGEFEHFVHSCRVLDAGGRSTTGRTPTGGR